MRDNKSCKHCGHSFRYHNNDLGLTDMVPCTYPDIPRYPTGRDICQCVNFEPTKFFERFKNPDK